MVLLKDCDVVRAVVDAVDADYREARLYGLDEYDARYRMLNFIRRFRKSDEYRLLMERINDET